MDVSRAKPNTPGLRFRIKPDFSTLTKNPKKVKYVVIS